MAERTDLRLIDDIDGTEANATCQFGLDGKNYEIELSEDNYRRLWEVLGPYVAVARQVPNVRRKRRKKRKK